MDILEKIILIEEANGTIINYINSGNEVIAGRELYNLSIYLSSTGISEEIIRYHSGPNFLASLEILKDKLIGGKDYKSSLDRFRVYLAQLKLSIKTNNTFH